MPDVADASALPTWCWVSPLPKAVQAHAGRVLGGRKAGVATAMVLGARTEGDYEARADAEVGTPEDSIPIGQLDSTRRRPLSLFYDRTTPDEGILVIRNDIGWPSTADHAAAWSASARTRRERSSSATTATSTWHQPSGTTYSAQFSCERGNGAAGLGVVVSRGGGRRGYLGVAPSPRARARGFGPKGRHQPTGTSGRSSPVALRPGGSA